MKLIHILGLLLLMVLWSLNYVVIKVGLENIPPLLLCALSFFLVSIPAVFIAPRPRVSFRKVALYGLVMFALQFGFFITGMNEGIAPGLASLLLQVHVFFTAILGYIFFKEKWHAGTVCGALIAFSGIGLVAYKLSQSVTLTGFILVLAAALSWSLGNVVSKKIGTVNMISLVIWGCLISWPPLLVISVLYENIDVQVITSLTLQSLGCIAYITYLSTLLGYAAWSFLLQLYPLKTIAPFTLLIPVFALISSALLLGEPLEGWKIGAASLVIAGLIINILHPHKRMK